MTAWNIQFFGSSPHLIKLLIRFHHLHWLDSGRQATLYSIRQQFCFQKFRIIIRLVTQSWTAFARLPNIAFKPAKGPLTTTWGSNNSKSAMPGWRFNFTGEYQNGTNRKTRIKNAYIASFTCCITKAVHLVTVSSITIELCITACKRLVACSGVRSPESVFNRNRSNFIEPRKALSTEICSCCHEVIFSISIC